jgi:hypothetical protein
LADGRTPDPAAHALVDEAWRTSAMMDGLAWGRSTPGGWGIFGRIFRPFVRMAHAKYLREMAMLIETQSGPRPHQAFPLLAAPTWWSPMDRVVSLAFPGLERSMQTSDDFQTSMGAAGLAVALRRYRIDHGSYPPDLSALVPAYLGELPNDMATGRPPIYSRVDAGFTLTTEQYRGDISSRPSVVWRVPR